jgi:ribosomal protein S18 acetylase RimI-like enzyme
MRMIARDDYHFHVIKQINDLSFSGIERPTGLTLKFQYDTALSIWTKEVDQKIVAYALLVADSGPYVWSVATHPTFRSRGFAGALLDEAAEWHRLDGAQKMDLTVNVNNPAQKLYFDHGFRAVQVYRRYYGEAAGLRMRRSL